MQKIYIGQTAPLDKLCLCHSHLQLVLVQNLYWPNCFTGNCAKFVLAKLLHWYLCRKHVGHAAPLVLLFILLTPAMGACAEFVLGKLLHWNLCRKHLLARQHHWCLSQNLRPIDVWNGAKLHFMKVVFIHTHRQTHRVTGIVGSATKNLRFSNVQKRGVCL